MKKYIVINSTNLYFIEKESSEDAKNWAINSCDNSKEIIVREYTDAISHIVVKQVYENIIII